MGSFDNYVECEYMLSGLTTSELTSVSMAIANFSRTSAQFIHSGFDHDLILEYHHILVDISGLNGYSLDILDKDEFEPKIFENRDFITIQSKTLCRAVYCQVISGESAAYFNQTKFTDFVTLLFQQHFRRNDVSGGLEIEFIILNIGETMDLLQLEAPPKSHTTIYVVCFLIAAIVLIGLIAYMYHGKYMSFKKENGTNGFRGSMSFKSVNKNYGKAYVAMEEGQATKRQENE